MSKLGIIAALPAEAKCLFSNKISLASPVEIQKDIFLCLTGIGYDSASTGVNKLRELNVDALVSWGVAGAIHDSLQPGDLLIADSVIGENHNHVTSVDWINRVNAHHMKISSQKAVVGSIASIAEICSSVTNKRHLSKKTGALAIDMESAAIAELATAHNMDFIVLRAIADDANTTIPEAVLKHTNELGQPRIVAFMSSCLKRPGQIIDLIKLAICYEKALKTLKQQAPDLKKQHFLYNTPRLS